jgi:hypothetical protein
VGVVAVGDALIANVFADSDISFSSPFSVGARGYKATMLQCKKTHKRKKVMTELLKEACAKDSRGNRMEGVVHRDHAYGTAREESDQAGEYCQCLVWPSLRHQDVPLSLTALEAKQPSLG